MDLNDDEYNTNNPRLCAGPLESDSVSSSIPQNPKLSGDAKTPMTVSWELSAYNASFAFGFKVRAGGQLMPTGCVGVPLGGDGGRLAGRPGCLAVSCRLPAACRPATNDLPAWLRQTPFRRPPDPTSCRRSPTTMRTLPLATCD